jgi:hypothetical protein
MKIYQTRVSCDDGLQSPSMDFIKMEYTWSKASHTYFL